ncbi:hemerythrin-like metal-binding protein [Methanocaldococcus infernus ME]|uniref:Hemerythrin-like metal-binding protein n=1 Tax=Methanocaldococcus infernus (strain DSM 11812 / JCM 15783 / ME) TaxID=573063 RepID=D5VTJ4_METIM|nr:bacteriohemerythrin [Methanocaldococcus infernus]ADG13897.1 hemerythrin-like metal-binding protein [Methanocaldococcus infernus ME]
MKEIIKWSKDLETGISTFDEEHKTLIETLNEVYSLLENKESEKAKELLRNNIVEYASKHFKHEEEIMEKYNYPELENHKKIHNMFVNMIVNKMLPKIEKSDSEFRSVVSFLVGWLVMHIKNMDKKYGRWFKENNITINDEPRL